jgi:adenosine kinase
MKIVCTGSVAYDYLMSFPGYFKDHILADRLESISLSFLVDAMVKQRGGVAPNIAYTLALLGARPILLATVGEDFSDYRAWLEENKIDTTGVKVIPGTYTASFFANTDLANAQIASFYAGAMSHASELKIAELPGSKPDLVIISPNSPEAMRDYPRECQAAEIPYLYDPSQQIVRLDGAVLKEGVLGAESLFVNEYEFELLLRATGLSKEEILAHVSFMVVTLGAKGAVVYCGDSEHAIEAFPTDTIVDPTGVGDAFRGGFLTGYRCGLDWVTCGQMGSLAAAYCLEQRGPQNHFYTPSDFVARYRTVFNDDGQLDCLLK